MLQNQTVQAVILAAGSSTRYGFRDKLYEPLGGHPLLWRSVHAFLEHPAVDAVVLVARQDRVEFCRGLFAGEERLTVIPGGESRCESSLLGVKAAEGDLVLVHDGARPFLSGEVIDRCLAGALETGAAVAGVPAVDTVKVCDSGRMVRYTTPRKDTWLIQSPQTFRRKLLLEAYEQADPLDPSLTDDCMVMEQAGFPVQVVMGSRDNFKVTRPEDYQHALALCRREEERPAPASVWRTGIGQDSHRFEEPATGKPLILGGVTFSGCPGLSANSDGDVVLHALCNAISGITCENILGTRAVIICSSGEKNSQVYVLEALKYLRGRLTHLSFTIECARPIISPYIPQMRRAIGELTGLGENAVGLTATSGEQLTDFGRGLGISVFCIATAEEVG